MIWRCQGGEEGREEKGPERGKRRGRELGADSLKKLFEREKRTPAADCLVLLTDKRNLVEIDADRVEEWANRRLALQMTCSRPTSR
jgi:hypothetical protein